MADENVKSYTMNRILDIELHQESDPGLRYSKKNEELLMDILNFEVNIASNRKTGYVVALINGHGKEAIKIKMFVAERLKKSIHSSLMNLTDTSHQGIRKAVTKELKKVSQELEKESNLESGVDIFESGCTVCVSLIVTDFVYTWQIGDILVLSYEYQNTSRNNMAFKVQEIAAIHTLEDKSERARIMVLSGAIGKLEHVDNDGHDYYQKERIYLPNTKNTNRSQSNYSLVQTRTLGDLIHHLLAGVIDEPTFSKTKIRIGTRYLVWMDGGYLNKSALTEIIQENDNKELHEICEKIVESSIKSWEEEDERLQKALDSIKKTEIEIKLSKVRTKIGKNREKTSVVIVRFVKNKQRSTS